jgi:hypothetical protein
VGWVLALLPVSACGLGLGGTGAQQDDVDAGSTEASTSTGSQTCTPFAVQSCDCPGGGSGTSRCPASGQAFGACQGCPVHLDAGAHDDGAVSDSRSGATGEAAAVDAGVCNACIQNSCPGAVAACGPGSDCQALLACDIACTGSDASRCSDDCTALHPTGSQAFATYTLCALACGAGCLAEATGASGDDGGSGDDASDASDD